MQNIGSEVTHRWVCPKCGWAGPSGVGVPVRVYPVHCICGHVTQDPFSQSPPHYITCPHRGDVLQTINARKAGCGCSSSLVNIYHCRHFDEPVLTFTPDRCVDAIRQECSSFEGRICRNCGIPCLEAEVTALPHLAIELTPTAEQSLAGKNVKLGIALVPSTRDFGSVRTDRFNIAKGLTDDSPHAVAAVLDASGMSALLVDSEHRAQQIRPFTRRPVVSSIKDLEHVNGVRLVTRLNLIYHVCPLRTNDGWKDNLWEVIKRWSVFTGRKVLAIATGEDLHEPETVKQLINRSDAEYLLVPNDKELREVASFLPLLETIQSTDPSEASFYSHTKANSTADNAQGAWLWALAMYRHLLDRPEEIRELLRTFAAVGCCKMVWPKGTVAPYPTRLAVGNWMFAGTFFAFRHNRVFTKNWRSIPSDRYAAEAWLSTMFEESECVSVYQPFDFSQYPTPTPYDPSMHHGRL
jgi:hypothetical protein